MDRTHVHIWLCIRAHGSVESRRRRRRIAKWQPLHDHVTLYGHHSIVQGIRSLNSIINRCLIFSVRCFRVIDDNRNRKIDRDELGRGLGEFGLEMSSQQVNQLFDELDKDHSGNVNFDEFLQAIRVN